MGEGGGDSEAKSTYIADPEVATQGLAAMAARAEVMADRVKTLTARIAGLETGRPWGTAEEYGGRFEKVYHSGEGGAEFVRQNVHTLAEASDKGARAAHQALVNSTDLDHDGAALFRLPGSSAQVDAVSSAAQSQETQQFPSQ
jgi:hypothetical protein